MHAGIRFFVYGLLCAAGLATAAEAPVRIVVGFPPGGGADVVARLVADKMKDTLGCAVVVENRPGAGGQVVMRWLKTAAPDGRVITATAPAPMTLAKLTHRSLDYDPVTDFAPVSLAATFDLALVVGPGAPARTFAEFLQWLRQDPKRGTFGSAATGSLPHVFGVLLGRSVDVEMVHVPYNGGGPLVTAIAGGQIPAGILLVSEAIALHQAGKVRMLATSGAVRTTLAPDVPTFAELGHTQIVGGGWIAFYAPPGTPPRDIQRLSAAIAAAVKSPDVAQKLASTGFEPVGSSPEALTRRMLDDMARYRPVTEAAGLVKD